MGRRALILLAPVAVLAACGGGDGKKAQTTVAASGAPVYRRGPTETCLRKRGFTLRHDSKSVGFIAYTSVGGGVRATRGTGTDVILAFGHDGADAQATLDAVKRNKKIANSAIFRYRIRRSNVVLFWAYRPSRKSARVIDGCLRPKAA